MLDTISERDSDFWFLLEQQANEGGSQIQGISTRETGGILLTFLPL